MQLGRSKGPRIPDIDTVGVVQAADKYANALIEFYSTRAWWHRKFYRLTGIAVILTSVSLPVLTSLDYPGKSLSISILGSVVAAITALGVFYHWDQSWVLLRSTEILLTRVYLDFRGTLMGVPSSRQADDPAAREAARQLLVKLSEIRLKEANEFFEQILSRPGKATNQTT